MCAVYMHCMLYICKVVHITKMCLYAAVTSRTTMIGEQTDRTSVVGVLIRRCDKSHHNDTEQTDKPDKCLYGTGSDPILPLFGGDAYMRGMRPVKFLSVSLNNRGLKQF